MYTEVYNYVTKSPRFNSELEGVLCEILTSALSPYVLEGDMKGYDEKWVELTGPMISVMAASLRLNFPELTDEMIKSLANDIICELV